MKKEPVHCSQAISPPLGISEDGFAQDVWFVAEEPSMIVADLVLLPLRASIIGLMLVADSKESCLRLFFCSLRRYRY